MNSSMVDGFDGLVPHLHARDLTMMLVSRAPLAKLQTYKRRMGWRIPWASSANSDFNFDLGASSTEEQIREQMPRIGGREVDLAEALEGLPLIARQNAAACGTDVLSYICESPMVSAVALEDGAVYQTYTSIGVGSSSSWATTPSSTVHRRDATRATTTSRPGFAATISMRRVTRDGL